MFEFYNETLCVHGGWLYKGAKVMKKHHYDNYVKRGPFNVLRRAGGKNTPALIAWVSIPHKYQTKIIDKYGDPTHTAKHIIFADYLVRDPKAVQFYANYTLDSGDAITGEVQAKYAAEAAIMKAVNTVLHDRILKTKALGSGGMCATWKKLAEVIHQLPRHTWPHALPKNHRSLRRKYEAFLENSYEALIHGGHGLKNAEKINDSAKIWVIGRWANQVNKVANFAQLLQEYNEKAANEGWKLLKEEKTLYNYLQHPDIKMLWEGYRYGELKSKENRNYQHSTNLPSMRDSLWYSDGTKLNLYYRDENGKTATCMVYEVLDVYSDVLLGFHISKSEDYEAQYHAYKMAVKNAGHRPYQIGFDGQGGHKKLLAGNFLGKVAHLAIKTQPYNGKSKTIESAFGRFQMQVMKKLWYFTGQNITAKKDESKANMEFIMANQQNLPSFEEAKAAYIKCREELNSMPHYKTKVPKLDMYYSSHNPEAPEIGPLEMVDIFWIEREKPVTVTAFGITFTEKKQKYTYVPYTEDRMPDVEWLAKNVDRKVHIKYDPDDMGLIYLYEKLPGMGLRLLTAAETKVEIHRGKQEQEEWEAFYIKQIDALNKARRIDTRDKMDSILESLEMLPEQHGLNSPALKGIESQSKKNKVNGAKNGRSAEIGEYQKKISNMVAVSDEDEGNLYDEF